MADKPILFSGPMVRALLDGRKTQTRRVLPQAHPKFPDLDHLSLDVLCDPQEVWFWDGKHDRVGASFRLPIGPGDRLWVREAWAGLDACKHGDPGSAAVVAGGFYRADHPDGLPNDVARWRPSIHMPRKASRLTLTVTEVRVQRLRDIDRDDAVAEGIQRMKSGRGFYDPTASRGAVQMGHWFTDPVIAFSALWDSLNEARGYGWEANPWVVAYTFTVARQNIDAAQAA